jgi:hypothetical protein
MKKYINLNLGTLLLILKEKMLVCIYVNNNLIEG